jgi:uncharacterized protein YjiS (DUF1127 family)
MSTPSFHGPSRRSLGLALADAALGMAWRFVRYARGRRQLASLDRLEDRELADIGLDRSDVRQAQMLGWRDDPSGLLESARAGRIMRVRA